MMGLRRNNGTFTCWIGGGRLKTSFDVFLALFSNCNSTSLYAPAMVPNGLLCNLKMHNQQLLLADENKFFLVEAGNCSNYRSRHEN